MNHIIYHDHCMDGFGAAYVAAKAIAKSEEPYVLHPMDYGDPVPEGLDKEDAVFILDFSLPIDQLLVVCATVGEVIWLDHHKTAIDAWEKYRYSGDYLPDNLFYVLDPTRSGCGITWTHFWPNTTRPYWVTLIQDRDLWKFEYSGSKPFHARMAIAEKSVATWNSLLSSPCSRINEGELLLESHNATCQAIAENAISVSILGQTGLVANCSPQFASDVGHILSERNKTFGGTWHQDATGSCRFSLRSSDDQIDVSEIAKERDGGGHRNAAGFTVSFDELIVINGVLHVN